MRPDFKNLPFYERPDLTPYLIHLTKNTKRDDGYGAFANLVNILKTGEVYGSGKKGFVRGAKKAACFMDIPFMSLKYVLNEENCNDDDPRYEPFGIAFTKKWGYNNGCRPVLYLSNSESKKLNIPDDELWRIVRFEVDKKGWISWLHEREWRAEGDFKLPNDAIVLVKNTKYATKLSEHIIKNPDEYAIKPRAILPLNVVCQGLYYL